MFVDAADEHAVRAPVVQVERGGERGKLIVG